jgi:hypothetical protein
MIAIINRSGADVPPDQPHRYTVQINSSPVIAEFEHRRCEPLSECLLRASLAVKKMEAIGLAKNPFDLKEQQDEN